MPTKQTSRLVDGSLALRARQRASGAAQPKAAASPKAKKIAAVIVVFGLLVGAGFGGVWAWNYMGRQARLAKIDEFRNKMQDPSLTDEQRGALWGENRQLFEGLSREDRRAAFQGGGFGRGRNEEDRIKKFLAMTQDEQNAELDKEIKRRLDREKEREARDKERAADAAKTNGSDTNASQDGKTGSDGSGSDGGGPRAAKTDAQRKLAMNSRLSSIPPQQRVERSQSRQLSQYFNNMVQSRAAQQGISLPAPPSGGFGRRGG